MVRDVVVDPVAVVDPDDVEGDEEEEEMEEELL